MRAQGRVNRGSAGASGSVLIFNRLCCAPRSITTASASIATKRTPRLRRSPARKLRGGPSLRLRIATAPRAPANTPDTLISIGAGWLENHCKAVVSTRAATFCGATIGAWDSAVVSRSDDHTNPPAKAATNAADCKSCGADKRKVNAKTKPPCCPAPQSTGQPTVFYPG